MHFFSRQNLGEYIFIKCCGEWVPCAVYWDAVEAANHDRRLRDEIGALEEKYISKHAHRIMAA